MKILPGTGRGTAARSAVVEGAPQKGPARIHPLRAKLRAPSTMLRMVPLPIPGRI
jgi:hypothetical protein